MLNEISTAKTKATASTREEARASSTLGQLFEADGSLFPRRSTPKHYGRSNEGPSLMLAGSMNRIPAAE